jgi:hypothetical protein
VDLEQQRPDRSDELLAEPVCWGCELNHMERQKEQREGAIAAQPPSEQTLTHGCRDGGRPESRLRSRDVRHTAIDRR